MELQDMVIDQINITKLIYPKINKNSARYTKGITVPLTQQYISYKFLNLEGIGKMPIYILIHCIMVEESANINSLKHFILRLKSIIVAGKTEVNNLYKTFLNLFL